MDPLIKGHLCSGDTFLWYILPFNIEGTPIWDTFAVALRCPLIRGFTVLVNYIMYMHAKNTALYESHFGLFYSAGIQESVFHWMLTEANRLKVPAPCRQGGLILDEIAIQPDLGMERCGEGYKLMGFAPLSEEANIVNSIGKTSNSCGEGYKLVGFATLGEEANILNSIGKTSNKKDLATRVTARVL